jgi:hypothetical protein
VAIGIFTVILVVCFVAYVTRMRSARFFVLLVVVQLCVCVFVCLFDCVGEWVCVLTE